MSTQLFTYLPGPARQHPVPLCNTSQVIVFCNLGDRLLSPSLLSDQSEQQIQKPTARTGTECYSPLPPGLGLQGPPQCGDSPSQLSWGQAGPPPLTPVGFQGISIPFQRCQTTLVPVRSESRFLSGPDHGRLFSIPGDCCNLNDCFNKNSKLSKVSWASLVCLLPQPGCGRARSCGR